MQIFVAVCPPGKTGYGNAEDFFKACLAIPVVLLFWVIGYFWKKPQWLTVDKIDLDTGLREHDWDEINAYRAKVASWPAWRRFFHKFM
jgi:amino acid transporter